MQSNIAGSSPSLSLFQKTLLSLIPTALLITLCYYWADPAFAFWVNDKHFARFSFFDDCTHLVDLIMIWSLFYFFYFAWSFSQQQQTPSQPRWPFLNVATSVAIAIFIKDAFKMPFGRYWPNTWVNNNPSLIHDHAYGFHWFHKGVIYQSFPSGHTTVAVAFMVSLWTTFPRGAWRCFGTLVAAAIVIGLLADNYHFIGDCVAGGWIGAVVAVYVTHYQTEHLSKKK